MDQNQLKGSLVKAAERVKILRALRSRYPEISQKSAEAFCDGFFGKIAEPDPRGGLLAPIADNAIPVLGPMIYGAVKSPGDRGWGATKSLGGSALGAAAGGAAGGVVGSAAGRALILGLLAKKPQLLVKEPGMAATMLGLHRGTKFLGAGVGGVVGSGLGQRRAVMGKKPEQPAIGLIKAAGILPPGALARFGELLTGSQAATMGNRLKSLGQGLPSVANRFRAPILDEMSTLQPALRSEQAKVWGTRGATAAGVLGADYGYTKATRPSDQQAPINWKKFLSGNADDIALGLKNFVE